ncbi:inorganic pyrophosphatase [Tribonema minus]|uniref:inorganic diphosphatase n=1 Tax=Tribonema minus TaxID=303371 RepID=A0A836CKW0_9STRA|nr:inorganic pyrophosphatase [Tribonema minus]
MRGLSGSVTVALGVMASGTSAFTGAPVRALHRSSAARFASARRVLAMSDVSLVPKGAVDTQEYRVFFNDKGKDISPWHDIPLKGEGELYNFVCEIPKFTKAKMEIATKEPHNPIAQDIKKGALRFYHGPIFWNYGYLPQTWEDPNVKHPELGVMGDGDPVDVVEIGSTKLPQGSLKQVRALGCLAMIDDGELDWKVIAIAKDDPLAAKLHDIKDVEEHCPGVVSGIREWFRWYKTPDDKPVNEFGFGERALDAKETADIISECNGHWKALVAGKTEKGKLWTP